MESKKQQQQQQKKKKKKRKNCFLFSFPLSDNISRKIYQSIHPKTSGASNYI